MTIGSRFVGPIGSKRASSHTSRIRGSHSNPYHQAIEDNFNQEEGFTFFNGFVKGFSRWRDSPALYISYSGHKGPVYSFQVSSDLNYILSASEDTLLKLWDTHTGRRHAGVWEAEGGRRTRARTRSFLWRGFIPAAFSHLARERLCIIPTPAHFPTRQMYPYLRGPWQGRA